MKVLFHIDRIISLVERGLAVLLFLALVGAITINIVSRNLFHHTFQQLLEYSPTLVLWLALVGTTLALKENRHIRLEVVLRFVPEGARLWAGRLSAVFGMAVMGILGIASIEFVRNEVAIFGSSGYVTLIFPLFFCLAAFRFFIQLLQPPHIVPPARLPGGGPGDS